MLEILNFHSLRNTNLSRTKINFYANFIYKLKFKILELNEEFDAKAIENLILTEFDRCANLEFDPCGNSRFDCSANSNSQTPNSQLVTRNL